jgi:hypothetical protein
MGTGQANVVSQMNLAIGLLYSLVYIDDHKLSRGSVYDHQYNSPPPFARFHQERYCQMEF